MSYNVKPVEEIPEVQAFNIARDQLQAFKEANTQFFDVLDTLIQRYNDTLEAADKAVRSHGASCGDFDYYQKQTKVDAKTLYESVGRESFLKAGGVISTKAEYKIDAKKLSLAVAQNIIAKPLADEVTKEEPRYHAPKPAVLP